MQKYLKYKKNELKKYQAKEGNLLQELQTQKEANLK